jgi:signal transduction histidine kinase
MLLDAAIAVAALAGSLALLHGGGVPGSTTPGNLDGLGVALAVGTSAPLVAWRRAPIGVFAVVSAASVLLAGLGYPLGIPLGAAAALYFVAASRDEGHPWTPATTTVVVVLTVSYVAAVGFGKRTHLGMELFDVGFVFAATWFAGERTRLRREYIAELERRAVRAERDAEHERRLAVAEERVRIARDLHDAAGHAINVIAVRAGAARLRQNPERSQAALESIEDIAQQTAAEIDGIVGTLRDRGMTESAVAMPLGLASLETLITRHAAAGLDVRQARQGIPQPLETATDQAAFRILQEALTNAARHGTGSAQVDLSFESAALELTISNPTQRNAPATSGEHGLIGMRERATLLGGTLDAVHTNGTFRVRAHLPYRSPTA